MTSTAAVAQRAQPTGVPTVNPYAYIGLYGSQASAKALCGNAASVAVAGAAVAQAPGAGCVLPVLDAPPPASVPAPPAPAAIPPAAASGGFGLTPLLLGLAALGGIIGLILLLKNDDDDSPDPISPD